MKKTIGNMVVFVLLLIVTNITTDICRSISKYEEKNYAAFPIENKYWNVLEKADENYVKFDGVKNMETVPYGCNAGIVEELGIERAVLLLPGDAILQISGKISGNMKIELTDRIHPAVAETSDGAVLKISIECDKMIQNYAFDVGNEVKEEVIELSDYVGKSVDISMKITNRTGANTSADWVVLEKIMFIAE